MAAQKILSIGLTTSQFFDREIVPCLTDLGFSRIIGRRAWKISELGTQVMELNFLSAHQAMHTGASTMSFWIELGFAPHFIPPAHGSYDFEHKTDGLPQPAECVFRSSVQRGFFQPIRNAGIWFVDSPQGRNVLHCSADAKAQLQTSALHWFSLLDSPQKVYTILSSANEVQDLISTRNLFKQRWHQFVRNITRSHALPLWGFGNNPSPQRSYCLAYTCLHLNLLEESTRHSMDVLNGPAYSDIHPRLKKDMKRAK